MTDTGLILKTQYWHDRPACEAFKRFMLEIFGLDFTEWEEAGYWDDAYTPFSFFKDDEVVASVCIYLLDAVVEGRKTHLVQISGVGTLPDWRRQGLNRRLTDIGLDWARGRHEGIFLFSDPDAVSYYERCGFHPFEEFVEVATVTPQSGRPGTVHLDPGKEPDRRRIFEYAKRRAPVSNRLGVLNERLLMFHVLGHLRTCVYEIPDLDCLVLFERKEDRLCIFDIVGEEIPELREFHPYIADGEIRIVEFHFSADKLGLESSALEPLRGTHPFTRGEFPVQNPVFPFTART